MQKFLISFVLLAAFAQIGSGLQCWECSEVLKNGETCKDPFTSKAAKATCPLGHVCVKQVTPKISIGEVEVPPAVTRGCGDSSVCESPLKEVSGHCSICSSDLCNSSGIAVPSLITIGALLLAAKCLYF